MKTRYVWPIAALICLVSTPLFAGKKWGLFDRHSEIEGYVPAMTQKEIAQYGRYLTWNVSGCRTCHTPQKAFWSSPDSFSGAKPEKKGLFGLNSDIDRIKD